MFRVLFRRPCRHLVRQGLCLEIFRWFTPSIPRLKEFDADFWQQVSTEVPAGTRRQMLELVDFMLTFTSKITKPEDLATDNLESAMRAKLPNVDPELKRMAINAFYESLNQASEEKDAEEAKALLPNEEDEEEAVATEVSKKVPAVEEEIDFDDPSDTKIARVEKSAPRHVPPAPSLYDLLGKAVDSNKNAPKKAKIPTDSKPVAYVRKIGRPNLVPYDVGADDLSSVKKTLKPELIPNTTANKKRPPQAGVIASKTTERKTAFKTEDNIKTRTT